MNSTMEGQKTSPASIGLHYGLITGAVLIIYSLILLVADLFGNVWLNSVGNVFLILLIVMAHKKFKEENNGFMSYAQGLGIGSVSSLVAGFLTGTFTFLYFTFIDNSVLLKQLDEARFQLEEGGMDDAQIDQIIGLQEKMMPFQPFLSAVMMLIFGFILTLIIAAFTKKEKPIFE